MARQVTLTEIGARTRTADCAMHLLYGDQAERRQAIWSLAELLGGSGAPDLAEIVSALEMAAEDDFPRPMGVA